MKKVQAFQYISLSLNMLMNIDMTINDNLATPQGKGVEGEEIILTKQTLL
jgi:hypothetical protein